MPGGSIGRAMLRLFNPGTNITAGMVCWRGPTLPCQDTLKPDIAASLWRGSGYCRGRGSGAPIIAVGDPSRTCACEAGQVVGQVSTWQQWSVMHVSNRPQRWSVHGIAAALTSCNCSCGGGRKCCFLCLRGDGKYLFPCICVFPGGVMRW
jgi:hypothetical protein